MLHRVSRVLLFVGFLLAPVLAQEVAVPDKPVTETVTVYRITGLSLDTSSEVRFTITYRDNLGRVFTDDHVGPSVIETPDGPAARPEGAEALVAQWNTADFRASSMTKQLFAHLVEHGKIPPSTVRAAQRGQ